MYWLRVLPDSIYPFVVFLSSDNLLMGSADLQMGTAILPSQWCDMLKFCILLDHSVKLLGLEQYL